MKFQFPPVNEYFLHNGMRLVWVPKQDDEILVVAIQLPIGKCSDPRGLNGLTELLVSLIQKGPASLSSEEFAWKVELDGASISADVGDEYMVISCRMLSRKADTIIPLFWDMITKPAFRAADFKRLKRETTGVLHAEATDPSALSMRHFYAELCGTDHPAGNSLSLGTIKEITLDHLVSHYDSRVVPEVATLIFAGNCDAQRITGTWQELFENWQKVATAKPSVMPPLVPRTSSILRMVDKPDLTQTTIIIGHPAAGELDEDHDAIALANHILGNPGFSSRLMTQIRSVEGKTYGISSHVIGARNFGIFSITFSTRNAQVGSVLDSVINLYDEFCYRGVTQEELDKAKNYAIGNMAFQLETLEDIVDKILWLRFYNRSNSYFEKFEERLAAIKLSYINQVIRKHFSANNCVAVALGNRQETEGFFKRFDIVKKVNYRSVI